MRFLDWFRPGIRIKRWLLLGVAGIGSISFGLSFLFSEIYISVLQKVLALMLMMSGIVFLGISARYLAETFLNVISSSKFKISLDSDRLSNLLYEKRILIKGPKIVTIGGGTGLSTMLRGLKNFSSNITAIVTVADDGGGSGVIRQDLRMLPPGDIRNCILALADTEPIMEKLLQYRFEDGMLKGQSFGNLFLAAMGGISDSFEEAVRKMSDVLAVTGKVLPVTLDDMRLCAELEDGHIICGESSIGSHNELHRGRIKSVFLQPDNVCPLQDALSAIEEADLIVLGPGSLYTSIIPNLLVNGVCDSLIKSKAVKVYVCNVMTQPGETDGFKLSDHLDALYGHSYRGIIDYCIVNTNDIPEELKEKYRSDGAEMVAVDVDNPAKDGIKLIDGDFVSINNGLVRHNSEKLAAAIINLVAEAVLSKDRKRILDYYYVKDKMKKSANGH